MAQSKVPHDKVYGEIPGAHTCFICGAGSCQYYDQHILEDAGVCQTRRRIKWQAQAGAQNAD